MSLTYAAFHEPLTPQDIQEYTKQYNASTNAKIALFAIVLVSAIILALLSLLALTNQKAWIPFALPLVGYTIWALSKRKKDLARLYKFAKANGATLRVHAGNPQYQGMIFTLGHSDEVREAITFNDGRELGHYMFTTGSGRSRQTHHWGYMRVKLKRVLPHMVLDSRRNNGFAGLWSNLPATFNKAQVMKLEGDFNEHFTLYAPKGYERDALYVFTPDVMAALIDTGGVFDVEVVGDDVYFYSKDASQFMNEATIKPALHILDTVSAELIDQSDYYADARVGDRTANVVAQPGQRLKRRISIATIVIVILVLAYFVWSVLPR